MSFPGQRSKIFQCSNFGNENPGVSRNFQDQYGPLILAALSIFDPNNVLQ
jgi:hypothetical protein